LFLAAIGDVESVYQTHRWSASILTVNFDVDCWLIKTLREMSSR
jgi:hypothetical protein